MDPSDYNNAPASQVSAELTARFVALEQQQSHSNQQQQQLLQLVMTNQQQLQQLLEARQSFPHQQPPASTELPAEQQGPPIRLPVPRFEGKVPALADLTSVSEVDDVEIFIARMSSYFRHAHDLDGDGWGLARSFRAAEPNPSATAGIL
ncbi:hypothetical protein RI367_008688 [Sorochytrium milnesiophthora]